MLQQMHHLESLHTHSKLLAARCSARSGLSSRFDVPWELASLVAVHGNPRWQAYRYGSQRHLTLRERDSMYSACVCLQPSSMYTGSKVLDTVATARNQIPSSATAQVTKRLPLHAAAIRIRTRRRPLGVHTLLVPCLRPRNNAHTGATTCCGWWLYLVFASSCCCIVQGCPNVRMDCLADGNLQSAPFQHRHPALSCCTSFSCRLALPSAVVV